MKGNTQQQLKKIKQSFRLSMNGSTAQSMREKGIIYQLNWGVPLPQLKRLASEYGKDYDLALELWKEDIRECKILATMIMPPEKMVREVADVWMEQTSSQEIAEIAAFNLYQNLEFASSLAFQWIASDREIYQMTGYQVLSRLFMKGKEPNKSCIKEFIDEVLVAIQSDNLSLRHAAGNCLVHFCELGVDYDDLARKAIKPLHLDFFD